MKEFHDAMKFFNNWQKNFESFDHMIEEIHNKKKVVEDRPATPEDIADVQAQLAQVSNDPNLTLVLHGPEIFFLTPATPLPKPKLKTKTKKVPHVPNVIPRGRWNQYLFGSIKVPVKTIVPTQTFALKSFEGTVCGKFEISE